ncbi:MAG TPA: AarF/ABC1/UbiB kinase family protein [Candidatus Binataceae bacterium]|jgi:predicted unusual protein kinase regulating ubiquinone biosynthesis (AarF/ABC1/UbiB family)|nr:AarF/ABC1/UbiB kinase family protein [Candidatus Binataceae bacterium]
MAVDKSLTSGRARRAMKIGGLASHVGSSYLWASLRKPFLSEDAHTKALLDTHIKNARRIVEGSKELRGAFLKLIQMLSTREDILPAQALEVLSVTQAGVPPMNYATISEQVRRELGKKPEQLFASFDREAFAAASLGQVHRASLAGGEQVAVKIQYPGVEQTVGQDLKNLKLLLTTLKAFAHDLMRQKIDVRTVYAELEERLSEELDYEREAANMKLFAGLLRDDPEVMIPRVFPQLSSRRVLTMTYLDGYPLTDVFAPVVDPELKSWVVRKYFTLIWRQVLEFGVLHTDPHPGNYLVTYHPRLGMLDFGSIRRFPEPIRKANLKLARALLGDNDRAMAQALVALGFLDRTQPAAPLIEIVRILFEPVLVNRRFDPKKYESVTKATTVGEIAFQHRLYKSPAHSVFLIRALIGAEGIVRQLGVVANYHAMFRQCVENVKD